MREIALVVAPQVHLLDQIVFIRSRQFARDGLVGANGDQGFLAELGHSSSHVARKQGEARIRVAQAVVLLTASLGELQAAMLQRVFVFRVFWPDQAHQLEHFTVAAITAALYILCEAFERFVSFRLSLGAIGTLGLCTLVDRIGAGQKTGEKRHRRCQEDSLLSFHLGCRSVVFEYKISFTIITSK